MRRVLFLLALGLFPIGLATSPAPAAITTIEVRYTEPFADGTSFGATGTYVKVVGVAHGELDPAAPANRAIVNLDRRRRTSAAGSSTTWTSTSCAPPIRTAATIRSSTR